MEDGINEYGLAVGLTSVAPTKIKPGINAGMLLRLFLEKCKSVTELTALIGNPSRKPFTKDTRMKIIA